MSMVINLVEDHNIYLCEGGPVYNGGVQPTPITYLTQWKIVGNSEVHGAGNLTSWKVSGNSVVQDGVIMSCGDLGQDGKYHVKISNGVNVFDIALDAPLRKVNDVADTIEFPSSVEGKALVTRYISDAVNNIGDTIAAGGMDVATPLTPKGKSKSTNILSTIANQNGISASGSYVYFTVEEQPTTILPTWKEENAGKTILYELATPTTELVDAPQIEEADSYTCVISQGAKAVSWSGFETE